MKKSQLSRKAQQLFGFKTTEVLTLFRPFPVEDLQQLVKAKENNVFDMGKFWKKWKKAHPDEETEYFIPEVMKALEEATQQCLSLKNQLVEQKAEDSEHSPNEEHTVVPKVKTDASPPTSDNKIPAPPVFTEKTDGFGLEEIFTGSEITLVKHEDEIIDEIVEKQCLTDDDVEKLTDWAHSVSQEENTKTGIVISLDKKKKKNLDESDCWRMDDTLFPILLSHAKTDFDPYGEEYSGETYSDIVLDILENKMGKRGLQRAHFALECPFHTTETCAAESRSGKKLFRTGRGESAESIIARLHPFIMEKFFPLSSDSKEVEVLDDPPTTVTVDNMTGETSGMGDSSQWSSARAAEEHIHRIPFVPPTRVASVISKLEDEKKSSEKIEEEKIVFLLQPETQAHLTSAIFLLQSIKQQLPEKFPVFGEKLNETHAHLDRLIHLAKELQLSFSDKKSWYTLGTTDPSPLSQDKVEEEETSLDTCTEVLIDWATQKIKANLNIVPIEETDDVGTEDPAESTATKVTVTTDAYIELDVDRIKSDILKGKLIPDSILRQFARESLKIPDHQYSTYPFLMQKVRHRLSEEQ